MDDLIEALSIFKKYMEDVRYPTMCEHDVLYVCCDRTDLPEKDVIRLEELGFVPPSGVSECWSSFRFGSA